MRHCRVRQKTYALFIENAFGEKERRMCMEYMVETKGLTKQYKGKEVVKDVDQIGRASCRERVLRLV